MPMNTIIRDKRKEMGLTQEQVAEFLNISTPAVNRTNAFFKRIYCSSKIKSTRLQS